MKQEVFNETDKIWKRLTKDGTVKELKFELEVYKKLLNFFMVGDYYYYIINLRDMSFDYVSPEIKDVLGYSLEVIDVPFMIDNIHPEDQPWFLNFENKVMEFFSTLSSDQIPNYKVRYDYRIKKNNDEYIRILQQVVSIQYENNAVLRTFGVHTDISHLKQFGEPVLSFIGMNSEPSYIDVKVKQKFVTSSSGLTKREHEILRLVAQGRRN